MKTDSPNVANEANCMDEFDPNALTVSQALQRIRDAISPVTGSERVNLRACLDRVLATDVVAPIDMPPFANSAMDGYALQGKALRNGANRKFRVIGEAFAGHPFDGEVHEGECVRITTGGVLPGGADTVVMQEFVTRAGDSIAIDDDHEPAVNTRAAGEDFRKGERVLAAGRRLNAADTGLLASLGLAEIDVRRKPVVAFFSTGDELRGVGQPLRRGEIHDSNRYTLHALLNRSSVEILDMGVVPDRIEDVTDALLSAAAAGDLIVSSGGVSVGDADYVKQALEDHGTIGFWKIAVKPGRPLAFGRSGDAWFFGLPGNPVSVMATFVVFVRPALQQLCGETPKPPMTLRATCTSALKKTTGREEYQRGILHQNESGRLSVETTGLQGSHVLSSMSKANCFIVIPLAQGDVPAGSEVDVIPFAGLF
ncbi:MAG: molybdopterin molybdotransferase MoeA [Gammaproteobacteria bacterium]